MRWLLLVLCAPALALDAPECEWAVAVDRPQVTVWVRAQGRSTTGDFEFRENLRGRDNLLVLNAGAARITRLVLQTKAGRWEFAPGVHRACIVYREAERAA